MTRKRTHTIQGRQKRRKAACIEVLTPSQNGPQLSPRQTLRELLACDLPDEVVDEALERPLDFGRPDYLD